MNNKKLWIDIRLSDEEMDFLWACISEENKEKFSNKLAGNICRNVPIVDKDDWFYEHSLKKLTEKMFYDDWNNYRKYVVDRNEDEKPKFELDSIWVNHQKQHEFLLLHDHIGLYSFVIFMRIPTHWKEQHALSISTNPTVTTLSAASNFQFVWSKKDSEKVKIDNFPLSSEDEGRMLFFPATLKHQVYPFFECEEERITISGNIDFYDPNRPLNQKEYTLKEYEEKEETLKIMESGVEFVKKELKQMKKEREKEETSI